MLQGGKADTEHSSSTSWFYVENEENQNKKILQSYEEGSPLWEAHLVRQNICRNL